MAFLGLQGQKPVFSTSERLKLNLAHLTSVPPFIKDFAQAFEAHCAFKLSALSYPDVHEIRTKDDIDLRGSMGLLFGMQHAPEGLTRDRVQELFDANIRVMGIAYDGPTEYGNGFKGSGGLTERGRDLIEWMSDVGMIFDVSHANDTTARMALNFIAEAGLSMYPMASHSGCDAVFPHARNMPDDIMWKIADLDGYVGILAITFFIAKQGDNYLEAFAQHVAHAIDVCDASKFVGIGSDCNHLDMTMTEARAHFDRMMQMLGTKGTFGEYFPDRPPELIENGSQMFDCLDAALTQFPDGVLGENFRKFLKRSLPRD